MGIDLIDIGHILEYRDVFGIIIGDFGAHRRVDDTDDDRRLKVTYFIPASTHCKCHTAPFCSHDCYIEYAARDRDFYTRYHL